MSGRAVPPADIEPEGFFTSWVPETVAADPTRRTHLMGTVAVLEFTLVGEGGGVYTLHLREGVVTGVCGSADQPDLRILLDLETWQRLNAGELSAPEAFLRRRVKLEGNLALAVKLHFIIG